MTKSPAAPGATTAGTGRRGGDGNGREPAGAHAVQSRIDRLVALSDHCTAAISLAEGLQERVLTYLLAMAIEEARTAMRQDATGTGR